MRGGNFRLLTRLLTRVERILNVNHSEIISKEGHGRKRQLGRQTRVYERSRQIALKHLLRIPIQATTGDLTIAGTAGLARQNSPQFSIGIVDHPTIVVEDHGLGVVRITS